MKARNLNNWNIVRVKDTDDIGIIRNDCLPDGMKRMVCIQFLDKTAVVIDPNTEVELIKDVPQLAYDALKQVIETRMSAETE